MTDVFSTYSEIYDLIYEDKPYREEAAFVAGLIARFARPAPRVLDLACGTGRHCFELEGMGYAVEGSDASPEMITVARASAETRNSRVVFHERSFQEAAQIGSGFDAVISMFSAIDYLTTHDELVLSLGNIHRLLVSGGLFIFDFWNGAAVTRDYSPRKVLRKGKGDREVVRTSTTTLDTTAQIARVDFHFECFAAGVKQREFCEEHRVRYFSVAEMQAVLEACDFEVIHRSGFLKEDLDPFDWNVTMVARKVAGS